MTTRTASIWLIAFLLGGGCQQDQRPDVPATEISDGWHGRLELRVTQIAADSLPDPAVSMLDLPPQRLMALAESAGATTRLIVLVADSILRSDTDATQTVSSIYRPSGGHVMVDWQRKQFARLQRRDASEQREALRKRLSGPDSAWMPPGLRAALQADAPELIATTGRAQIHGRDCIAYQLKAGDRTVGRVWLAQAPPGLRTALGPMATVADSPAKLFWQRTPESGQDQMPVLMAELKQALYGKSTLQLVELAAVDLGHQPESKFLVPPDFQEVALLHLLNRRPEKKYTQE